MHACEAAGIADLSRFYALPTWMQDQWLGHVYARLTGRYSPPPPNKTGDTGLPPDVLAAIERQRSAA